jgi:hypothetical protein
MTWITAVYGNFNDDEYNRTDSTMPSMSFDDESVSSRGFWDNDTAESAHPVTDPI